MLSYSGTKAEASPAVAYEFQKGHCVHGHFKMQEEKLSRLEGRAVSARSRNGKRRSGLGERGLL